MSAKNKSIAEIEEYIRNIINNERKKGYKEVILVSGDIHKALGLLNRMPSVCLAMYSINDLKYTILHRTPSGLSSSIKIKYTL